MVLTQRPTAPTQRVLVMQPGPLVITRRSQPNSHVMSQYQGVRVIVTQLLAALGQGLFTVDALELIQCTQVNSERLGRTHGAGKTLAEHLPAQLADPFEQLVRKHPLVWVRHDSQHLTNSSGCRSGAA